MCPAAPDVDSDFEREMVSDTDEREEKQVPHAICCNDHGNICMCMCVCIPVHARAYTYACYMNVSVCVWCVQAHNFARRVSTTADGDGTLILIPH